MEDDQEPLNQISTFLHQRFLVKVDAEICLIFSDLKVNNLLLLVFVDPHCTDEGALSVRLPPLFGLWIVQRQSDNAFSKVIHGVNPKQLFDLLVFEAEKCVDFLY